MRIPICLARYFPICKPHAKKYILLKTGHKSNDCVSLFRPLFSPLLRFFAKCHYRTSGAFKRIRRKIAFFLFFIGTLFATRMRVLVLAGIILRILSFCD